MPHRQRSRMNFNLLSEAKLKCIQQAAGTEFILEIQWNDGMEWN